MTEADACDREIAKEMAMDKSMVDGRVETFSTLVPETWAVASESQRETQKTEGGGDEVKVEANACNEEGSIIEACSIKRVNGYEAHEIEEIATKNDIESKVAKDQ